MTATSAEVLPVSAATPAPARAHARIDAIDALRGLVMMLMALDHVRDFVGAQVPFQIHDFSQVSAPLFLSRWLTHYCAPVFVLLAGASAYLQAARGKPRAELSRFLFTRGLWLIFLELTVVRFGWTFDPMYHTTPAQVIWAIGWSMIALAGLVYLPVRAVGLFGLAMIASHNLLDHVSAQAFGDAGFLYMIMHQPGPITVAPGHMLYIAYPLVPWIGVMAAGYAFGAWLEGDSSSRKRRLYRLGAALTLAFIALRAIDRYGDPQPWSAQPTALYTLLSFLNCTKYPPSLLYLLMTLGPSLLVLGWLEGRTIEPKNPLLVFGRVPMFYYLLHLPLAHAVGITLHVVKSGAAILEHGARAAEPFGLPIVYVTTIAILLALYMPCRWFGDLKRRRRDLTWLSYF